MTVSPAARKALDTAATSSVASSTHRRTDECEADELAVGADAFDCPHMAAA